MINNRMKYCAYMAMFVDSLMQPMQYGSYNDFTYIANKKRRYKRKFKKMIK